MECRKIIMNYTVPPSADDMEALAVTILEVLPDEFNDLIDDLAVVVDEMADETIMGDAGVEDPFDLLALYRSGNEISPGVEHKIANGDDMIILYRRAILDMWCEYQDDLLTTVRQIILEELGRCFEFSDDDVQDMIDRYC